MAIVTATTLKVLHRDRGHVSPDIHTLELVADDVSLDGYAHYMLKEIHEQPETIRNALRGRF